MDFIEALKNEQRVLSERLAAVQHMLAVYAPSVATERAPFLHRPAQQRAAPKSGTARNDRFGSYGASVVAQAVNLLPSVDAVPVRTSDLVEAIERSGLEIRGSNKTNALSAILARSSKIRGHGRRGWTREAGIESNDALNENEPNSVSAVGSEPADEGVTAPESASKNSNIPGRED